jgi:hippurate hydrolase
MTKSLLSDLKSGEAELIAIRRDIHKHPETAFEEKRTSDIVAERLTAWGIPIHRGLAKTGVVGTLKGKRPGQRVIGLRADMDALNLQEKNGLRALLGEPGQDACLRP